MKFLIIIPAHNEEKYILSCLESLKNQNYQDFYCIIVDDGSTDNTAKKVGCFIENNKCKFKIISLEKASNHQPGAKVVRTFYTGLETQNLDNFDVICKFDADVIFPQDYLESVNRVYEGNPQIGMVSGLVYIERNGEWKFENISSKNHIRGPIKSYRKECFRAIGGLRPVLGWDNIDIMLAKMYGFETFVIRNIWVKHLRPTADKYKNEKAKKMGEYFYNIGLNFPLAVISSLKSSLKNKSILEFFITIKSFLAQNKERELSSQEIKFIRNLRWKTILEKMRF